MITPVARSRDVIVYFKGDTLPVTVNAGLLSTGWQGGQGVRYVQGALDQLTVGVSGGRYGGFLLWGSDESADEYTSMTRNQLKYASAVMGFGGWLISTATYERYTFATRNLPVPTPIVYSPSQPLYFSLRGYWTSEDELTLTGSPEAPANPCGYVAAIPKPSTQMYLGVQTAC